MSEDNLFTVIEEVETWLDIPGSPGYQASSFGRVRSIERTIKQLSSHGSIMNRRFSGKILSPGTNSHGYLSVSLGSGNPKTVHSIIALTFIGPRNGLEVNHKDGDKLNNRPENLEYVTSTENNRHALDTGLRKRRVTQDDIDKMKEMMKVMSYREIGRRLGFHYSYVVALMKRAGCWEKRCGRKRFQGN